MKVTNRVKYFVAGTLVLLAGGGFVLWKSLQVEGLPPGFASGNGRIEATEVDVATKEPGRVEVVLVKEGDMVEAGQVLAQMDAAVLRAVLHEAEARQRQAEDERNVSIAIAKQREAEHALAQKDLKRAVPLAKQNAISQQKLDTDVTKEQTAKMAWGAAKAQITSAEAAIELAVAKIEKVKADIADATLRSPCGGRVEYRLVEPGEVIPAGGKVVTLLDITDVYMTFFLPTAQAGKVAIGADARIVLDALPGLPIPAKVSFVSPTAQFTPKEVETRTEREKLMFRVKVKVDSELLKHYAERVKTGLPGMGYVQIDAAAAWPESLKTRQQRGLPLPTPEDLQ
jgi:HlyD family secretion protein